jgi:hypothetical protein
VGFSVAVDASSATSHLLDRWSCRRSVLDIASIAVVGGIDIIGSQGTVTERVILNVKLIGPTLILAFILDTASVADQLPPSNGSCHIVG